MAINIFILDVLIVLDFFWMVDGLVVGLLFVRFNTICLTLKTIWDLLSWPSFTNMTATYNIILTIYLEYFLSQKNIIVLIPNITFLFMLAFRTKLNITQMRNQMKEIIYSLSDKCFRLNQTWQTFLCWITKCNNPLINQFFVISSSTK